MEVIEQPQAQIQSKPRLAHAFTRDTAAINARKSTVSREANRKARLALNALALDPYVKSRLIRVREQLEKIDSMMAEETDPQRLDRLASAQARLSVQEFALANRPMPGSRRPGRETPTKRAGEVGPVE